MARKLQGLRMTQRTTRFFCERHKYVDGRLLPRCENVCEHCKRYAPELALQVVTKYNFVGPPNYPVPALADSNMVLMLSHYAPTWEPLVWDGIWRGVNECGMYNFMPIRFYWPEQTK